MNKTPHRVSGIGTLLPRPVLFALGVLLTFVLVVTALLTEPEPEELGDEELAALIENPDAVEPLPPYYYETGVAKRSSIQIDSNPIGAFARLNAELVGLTPLGLSELRPGYYDIQIDHPDYLPLDTTLYLASGGIYEFEAVLEPRAFDTSPGASPAPAAPTPRRGRIQRAARAAPGGVAQRPTTRFARADAATIKRVWTSGSLSVASEPSGARVSVDDQPRGTTPLSVTGLRPGAHRVTLAIPGEKPRTFTVQIEAGAVYQLQARFSAED